MPQAGSCSFWGGSRRARPRTSPSRSAWQPNAVVAGGPLPAEQGGPPNPREHRTTCSTGSPVNCATGEFWHQFIDFAVPGHGVPLTFTRTYTSALAGVDSPVGSGWTDNYNMSLSANTSGNITITQEDGSTVTFHATGGGSYTAPPRVLATLTPKPRWHVHIHRQGQPHPVRLFRRRAAAQRNRP